VRWRDEQGRAHSQVVGRKADADTMDQELKRSKRLGALAPVATNQETVADFAKVWWARYVVPNLQRHPSWPTPPCSTSTSSPRSATCRCAP
jgi:hypothetical protein